MYLTPSVMAGVLKAFDAFIVHPPGNNAQISIPEVLYLLLIVGMLVRHFLTN